MEERKKDLRKEDISDEVWEYLNDLFDDEEEPDWPAGGTLKPPVENGDETESTEG